MFFFEDADENEDVSYRIVAVVFFAASGSREPSPEPSPDPSTSPSRGARSEFPALAFRIFPLHLFGGILLLPPALRLGEPVVLAAALVVLSVMRGGVHATPRALLPPFPGRRRHDEGPVPAPRETPRLRERAAVRSRAVQRDGWDSKRLSDAPPLDASRRTGRRCAGKAEPPDTPRATTKRTSRPPPRSAPRDGNRPTLANRPFRPRSAPRDRARRSTSSCPTSSRRRRARAPTDFRARRARASPRWRYRPASRRTVCPRRCVPSPSPSPGRSRRAPRRRRRVRSPPRVSARPSPRDFREARTPAPWNPCTPPPRPSPPDRPRHERRTNRRGLRVRGRPRVRR